MALRIIGQAGLAIIKHYEQGPEGGFAKTPYRCPAGHMTVGWGHKLQGKDAFVYPLSAEDAELILDLDLDVAENAILQYVDVDTTQNEKDALICLVFNIGNEAFRTSTLRRMLNAGNRAGAAQQFPRWCKGTVKGVRKILPGLVLRRAEEKELFLSA